MEGPLTRARRERPAGHLVSAVTRTRWRLAVDPSRCIRSASCTQCAPEAFELRDGKTASPVRDIVDPRADILDAALSCPAEAISVTDTGTGATLAPEP